MSITLFTLSRLSLLRSHASGVAAVGGGARGKHSAGRFHGGDGLQRSRPPAACHYLDEGARYLDLCYRNMWNSEMLQ